MFMTFEDRPSDSPLIERVWRCRGNGGGPFLSVAAAHLELVVTRLAGQTMVTLRGPEMRPTPIFCPPNGEWIGLRLRLGVFLPQLATRLITDRQDVNLLVAADEWFCLDDSYWDIPDFDNAESFVADLAKRGVVARDPAVTAMLRGDPQELSRRSVQRHFQRATGMTHGMFRRIERARHATNLLQAGTPILDVVHESGYFDQAHLSRSLQQLIGQTPAQVLRRETQLSFLYKTGGRR